ncbi:hypothetical protein Dimus_003416 [Dionaea muscipula]
MAEDIHDESLVLHDSRGSSVIFGAPAKRYVDGEELQRTARGSVDALSSPHLMVSVPSFPRIYGLTDAAAVERGCNDVMDLLPVVSIQSASGDGQAMGKLTGGLGDFLADDNEGDSLIPVTSVNFVCPSPRADSVDNVPLMLSGCDVHLVEGGTVSEEGLAFVAAREALRPSPIDGRRQPPLSPVEPTLVIGRGGLVPGVGGGLPPGGSGLDNADREGGDGGGGQFGRTYVHVVLSDRWADVELSCCPPADGGNFITMAESDGDAERWGSFLVGYFLQGSLPFGYVRSTLSRLWMKSGLNEVKSLDGGFFVFRFADSLSRDAVLEGGPWFVGESVSAPRVGVSPVTY